MSDMVERIMSRVGKTVRFKYPVNGKTITVKGVLKDRVVVEAPSWSGIPYPYYDVVDLIEFEIEGRKFEALRFGYYRVKNGRLNWASQTTLTEPLEVWKKILITACRRPWFRRLLEEVLEACSAAG